MNRNSEKMTFCGMFMDMEVVSVSEVKWGNTDFGYMADQLVPGSAPAASPIF
jgi:hypothetical protein